MECIPISIGQAFNFAWPIFKQRFGLFTAVLLTIFSAWVTLEIVVIAGQRVGILLWAKLAWDGGIHHSSAVSHDDDSSVPTAEHVLAGRFHHRSTWTSALLGQV